MDIKNEVLYRVYFLLFGLVLPAAFLLLFKTVKVGVIEGERWREQGKNNYVKYKEIEADRGNILAKDGSILATSIPYFDLYFDPVASNEKDFTENIDSLSFCLANWVGSNYTVGGLRDWLIQLRRDSSDRHILIKSKGTFSEKRMIEEFPLFNKGRFRGGLIIEQRNERRRPFGLLAQRAIGYIRDGAKPVGIEGAFDYILAGKPGGQFMINVDKKHDIWMPLEDLSAIDPKGGDDIVTTIDVNIQDVAEEALLRGLDYHDAEWGTAVVMDVKTGAIRAMVNLGRGETGWWETYNYAIGSSVEPGSTIKMASMLAMLEDGYVKLDDSVNIFHGKVKFYESMMVDASAESEGLDTTSIRHAFEISSNVGIASLIQKSYGTTSNGAQKFIKRLKQFNLNLPTGIELEGEASPYIKEAFNANDDWSGITLPWMAIGYEMRLTPLQLLTFYNAVANNGTMMKPYLVQAVQRYGETINEFAPTVIKRRIASDRSLSLVRQLLKGVVDNGTAHKLHTDLYDFAGKTGTAQINYRRTSATNNKVGGYRASFVGYFPAENPKYSCVVVIHRPRRNGFYGADVAGPVFREIADNAMATTPDATEPINGKPFAKLEGNMLPGFDVGNKEDLKTVMNYLDFNYFGQPSTDMAAIRAKKDSILFQDRVVAAKKVPNVMGMGLKNALYSLENRGYQVAIDGFGKVVGQSVPAGTALRRGRTVKITLR
jgi:cell division protein FtsI (penicillin-binding protein 3)